ncbi:MAG: hypothetical protein IPM48_05805 [Saprospiraceae bacterium]|nr:hypothetical protein [Saprospiraceae bacterium]
MNNFNQEIKNRFHDLLKENIKDKKRWVNELAELLNCSITAIYKKNRADHFYTVDEMLFLIKHYSIDTNDLFGNLGKLKLFSVPNIVYPIRNIEEYLTRLSINLSGLDQEKEAKVFYATRELPIFYYFLYPNLALFMFYVFAKTVWKVEQYIRAPFDSNGFPPDLISKIKTIWDKYANLNTFEYWNTNVIDITLEQIRFYFEAGDLDKDIAMGLLVDLESTLQRIKEMAMTNSKQEGLVSNFHLYENKILHTSNHVLVQTKNLSSIYIAFDHPNFIISRDVEFLEYSNKWYQTIEENSFLLGKGSGHMTSVFFNHLHYKINITRKQIEAFQR